MNSARGTIIIAPSARARARVQTFLSELSSYERVTRARCASLTLLALSARVRAQVSNFEFHPKMMEQLGRKSSSRRFLIGGHQGLERYRQSMCREE